METTKEKGSKYEAPSKNEKPKWLTKNKPPDPKYAKVPRKSGAITWYWCAPETGGKCKGRWRAHKPSECKGLKRRSDNDKNKEEKKDRKKKAGDKPKMKLAEAYKVIFEAQKAKDKSDDEDDKSEES